MGVTEHLIADNLDIWSSTVRLKSSAGRGQSNKLELYGIKKLRELILELAVRGLLVPQDPSDEPASELLKKIASEKDQLIKDKKMKKPKVLPAIEDDAKLFKLPKGWALERVGNLTEKLGSGSTPRGGKNAYVESGIPFLRSQNVWNDGLRLDDIAYVSAETHDKMSNTKVYPGDVLLNITGASLGRSTIFPENIQEGNVSQHVTIIRLIEPAMGRFIHLGILSPMIQKLVWTRQVGMAIEGLSKKVLETFEFPIPPLQEQARIVTKVDELMALCDQLEHQQETSITAHQTLVHTLLDALTTASERDGFNAAWARIADHFDTLFTTQWSIDQLKQTILRLAVLGKLVSQDPNEEPASLLLDDITTEKVRLTTERKIGKRKKYLPLEASEVPFTLPQAWGWARLGAAGISSTGKTPKTSEKKYYGGDIPFLGPGQITQEGELRRSEKSLTEIGLTQSTEATPGTILMVCIGGSIGKNAVCNERLAFNQQINAIEPVLNNPRYMQIVLSSAFFQNAVVDNATGSATPIINRSRWENLPVPIAPLKEQERIVDKVDQIFTLCNGTKNSIGSAEFLRRQIADSIGFPGVVA